MASAVKDRACHGITLLEFLVSLVLIAILAAVLLDRLLYYQERAEKAAVEYALATVRMAMRLRMAELIIAGRGHEVPRMVDDNPMNWLDKPLSGYGGEYGKPRPGHWYYAVKEREIVYVPVNRRYLKGVNAEVREIRYRLSYLAPSSGVGGMNLIAAVQYRWF